MLFLAAPLAAALIAVLDGGATKHKHHRYHTQSRINSRHYIRSNKFDRSTAQETVLRRRVARMLRLALLQRREALLHDFLIRANTESPAFRDDRTYRLEIGIAIGPSQVTQDFVGSPIIRAHVANLNQTQLSVLLEAHITSAEGRHARATAAVSLQPGEARSVELLCPEKVAPASLIWSTMPL